MPGTDTGNVAHRHRDTRSTRRRVPSPSTEPRHRWVRNSGAGKEQVRTGQVLRAARTAPQLTGRLRAELMTVIIEQWVDAWRFRFTYTQTRKQVDADNLRFRRVDHALDRVLSDARIADSERHLLLLDLFIEHRENVYRLLQRDWAPDSLIREVIQDLSATDDFAFLLTHNHVFTSLFTLDECRDLIRSSNTTVAHQAAVACSINGVLTDEDIAYVRGVEFHNFNALLIGPAVTAFTDVEWDEVLESSARINWTIIASNPHAPARILMRLALKGDAMVHDTLMENPSVTDEVLTASYLSLGPPPTMNEVSDRTLWRVTATKVLAHALRERI